jgi:hypothetical protein
VLGEPTLTLFDFDKFDLGTLVSHDPADMDFRIWLGWHDASNRIYVALEQADDVYLNTFNRSIENRSLMHLHDSSMSFTINGNGTGVNPGDLGGLYDFGSAEYLLNVPREAQAYTAISEAQDDRPLVMINALSRATSQHGDWYARPPYADSDGAHFGERPTLSVTEFYVTPFDQLVWNDPEASVVSDLYAGKAVRFSPFIVDAEGTFTDLRYNKSFSYFIRGTGPSGLADGVLLGPGGALPEEEDTAVENDSWGRIKASFR